MIFTLFYLVMVVLWIFALVDLLKSNTDTNTKILWAVIIILLPILGVILYFLIQRPKNV
jgi:Phospholipase_D-nuclease N-terminal